MRVLNSTKVDFLFNILTQYKNQQLHARARSMHVHARFVHIFFLLEIKLQLACSSAARHGVISCTYNWYALTTLERASQSHLISPLRIQIDRPVHVLDHVFQLSKEKTLKWRNHSYQRTTASIEYCICPTSDIPGGLVISFCSGTYFVLKAGPNFEAVGLLIRTNSESVRK